MKKGFTLIELLVVVLIIGILAAVAVPQYQKAVEKAKAVQAQTLLSAVYDSAKRYFLANNEWPTKFDDLDITIPFTGTTAWYSIGEFRAPLSNQDWSIQLRLNNSAATKGVCIGRISGKYVGTAFCRFLSYTNDVLPSDRLLCYEASHLYMKFPYQRNFGEYCVNIFSGTKLRDGMGVFYQLS